MTETSQFVSAFCTGTTHGGECGPWARALAFLAWLCQVLVSWMSAWWPLLVVAGAVALLAGAVLVRVVRLRRRLERDGAVFFEIVPPFQVPVDGALSLWKMLAGVLNEHRTRRLCLELWAHGRNGTVRAGLWVPATPDGRALIRHLTAGEAANAAGPAVRRVAHQVAQGVVMTWPGCAVVPARAPVSGAGAASGAASRASAAYELAPRHGPWTAMLDHDRGAGRGARGPQAVDEPLRVVLGELSELARHGHYAAVQVVVSATTDPRAAGAAGTPGLTGLGLASLRGGLDPAARRRLAHGVARALARVVIGVLDEVVTAVRELLSPSSTRRASTRSNTARAGVAAGSVTAAGAMPGGSGQADPMLLARVRAREAKQRHGPHLRATVRFVVAGTATTGQARRAARALAGTLTALALDQDTTGVRQVRTRTTERVVAGREHGRGFIASVRELAAVWHVPDEPAHHGLIRPNVPQRRPDQALPRLGHPQARLHQTRPQRPERPERPRHPGAPAWQSVTGPTPGTAAAPWADQPVPGAGAPRAAASGSDWEEGARDAA